ncbi:MAG TPA: HAMP domain-containing sensor histidine kinase [Rhizomicrobium sp.]|nr:HAMP domain-containing sensor histidine kinase [Rhizomicrobium sp.]
MFRTLAARIAPRLDSLAARLIAAAVIWTAFGLLVGGFFLSSTFRSSVQDNFDTTLQDDLDGMIAAAEPDPEGGVVLEARFLNRRFERIYSGLYWQITPLDPGQKDVQISHSLFDHALHMENTFKRGNLTWGYSDGPDGQRLRVLAQRVEFPITATTRPDDTRAYMFLVAGDTKDVEAENSEFNGTLIWAFTLLGAGLIIAIFLQVRIGLQPLRRVKDSLARIRDGKARRLEGRFPSEIAPLAGELNSLIQHSEEVVGRARTHVANLAHFLKTPLTVLSSEADAQPGPLADAVKRQVDSMRRQVDHYLARGRAAGSLDVLGNRTKVKSVLDDLARVLEQIHERRGIEIGVECNQSLFFRGDRQDLEEMAGNLIDNACKWAKSQVAVRAVATTGSRWELAIEDDGPGLAPEDRERVLERGERLDESVPGSGLGLSIVEDIAKLYGGSLELGASALGGLKAVLNLPAIL